MGWGLNGYPGTGRTGDHYLATGGVIDFLGHSFGHSVYSIRPNEKITGARNERPVD